MNDISEGDEMNVPALRPISYGLVPSTMTEAMQLAEMMASSKLVPKDLQKSPADCLMVIQQAVRWQMDPFAVAQECSVIQGRLMHSGKLAAAVINTRGNLAGRLSFSFEGQGDTRTITVTGQFRSESNSRNVIVHIKDARTNARVWQTQPDQQLMYHGSRVWGRRHAPELMLGVYSPEEFEDPYPTAKARIKAIAELPEAEREAAADDMHEHDAARMAENFGNAVRARPEHDENGEIWEEDRMRPATPEDAEITSKAQFLATTREHIRVATDWRALGTWWNSDDQKQARQDFELTRNEAASIRDFCEARIKALKEAQG